MPHLVASPETRSPTELPDRDLMAAVAADDEAAFAELMDRKTKPLLGLAHRMVGDREEAKDLVQLTFLRVWEHRTRYDGGFSVNTWIYRITTNLAIDLLRSRQVRGHQAEPVRHHLMRLVSRRSDLESLFRREVMGILRDLAEGLSKKQRLAFLLREVEGLSSKEVAEILECRESTVRNHLFVARKYLRHEVRRRFPEYSAEFRAAVGEMP
jgi:RNA polymerase sigma-70 factor (ECF subfamily)